MKQKKRIALGILVLGLVLGIGQGFLVHPDQPTEAWRRCVEYERPLGGSTVIDSTCSFTKVTLYGFPFKLYDRAAPGMVTNFLIFAAPLALPYVLLTVRGRRT